MKSVSVLWAVGDADVSRHVEQAMDDAVAAGLRYLQDHAAFTRIGAGGIERIKAEGLSRRPTVTTRRGPVIRSTTCIA